MDVDIDIFRKARKRNTPKSWRIFICVPSIVGVNERFNLKITWFDATGMPSDEWEGKLQFVNNRFLEGLPDSVTAGDSFYGMLTLPVKAIEPGFTTIQAKVYDTEFIIESNPIIIKEKPQYRIFWGDLHIHTVYSDCHSWSCQEPQFAYEYAKNASGLDFAAITDHLRGIVRIPERWHILQNLVDKYYKKGEFVTFLGFESSHAQWYGGDNNVYFLEPDAPYFWLEREDMKGNAPRVHLKELWKWLESTGKTYITIPHHTGRARKNRVFTEDYYDSMKEPLFEIYSSWGSSERRYTRYPVSGGNSEYFSYFVDALKNGCRYGVIASSDDHTTCPGGESRNWMTPYSFLPLNGFHLKGLTAIISSELSRETLWRSMITRRTYGTTFIRVPIEFSIDDLPMGGEGRADKDIFYCRNIRLKLLLNSNSSARIILVRNGEDIFIKDAKKVSSNNNDLPFFDIELKDELSLDKVCVRGAKWHPEPFVVYYFRIETCGHTLWTSPVWIDL